LVAAVDVGPRLVGSLEFEGGGGPRFAIAVLQCVLEEGGGAVLDLERYIARRMDLQPE